MLNAVAAEEAPSRVGVWPSVSVGLLAAGKPVRVFLC